MTGSACQSQDAFIEICRNGVSMKIQFVGHLGGRCGFRHFAIGFAKVHPVAMFARMKPGSPIIFRFVKIRFCFRVAGNGYCFCWNILWTINFCSR